MGIDKKKAAITVLRYGSGFEAAARTVTGIKESFGRLGSLLMLIKGNANSVDRGNNRYVVFSPYLYQYGRIEDGNFLPEGTVSDVGEVPPGYAWYKGAYFTGNDFGELIAGVFTAEQIAEMISGADIRKALLIIGAATILALSVMFAAFGKWYGLASLPAVLALVSFAIKNGVYAARLRSRKMIGLSDYFREHGFVRWILA